MLLVAATVWLPHAHAVDGPFAASNALAPGTRVLLDAHNAYPEGGQWADRIERALSTGLPVAIEQDLVWVPATGATGGRSIVSHGPPFTGAEPSLDEYFFQRIAPIMEKALADGRSDAWPLVTLNLDFKDDEPAHLHAIRELISRYDSWLTWSERTRDASAIGPLHAGPLLVLTGESDVQERIFHDEVPMGDRVRLFGAVHRRADGTLTPATNYRRWSNNPWMVVEPEGQPHAGEWTADDERRLRAAVTQAHDAGLWIRFYTLDGFDPLALSNGWTASYNFGSLAAAEIRWRAAIAAGVDFVAVDQYEAFARVRASGSR